MRRLAILFAAAFAVAGSAVLAASDDAAQPKRHFKIKKPAVLTNAEALSIYDNVADQMVRGYAASQEPTAEDYRQWRRYNTAPYRSATHGNRYVNNYANAKAADYAETQTGAKLPPGAVIAKDSFTVTADKAVFAGALFVMEKLAPGTSPRTAEWRYLMILPDGSYFGDTTGDNADKVEFCHGCHERVADNDYLYFLPKKYRRQFLKP